MGRGNFLYEIRRKVQLLAYNITSPEFVSKLYFKFVLGGSLDLKNPKSFNEKLQWLKLYHWPYDKLAIKCADKYRVRDYVEKMGKGKILNELIGVWDNAYDINWDELPNSFVLKCNHGCGYNIICKNKTDLNRTSVLMQLDKWMHEDFSKFNAEPHYSKIERKIICEKFLEGDVTNYNIYVVNGHTIFFAVAGGLGDGKDEYLTYYYPDGSIADFKNSSFPIKKSELSPLLPEMIEVAECLACDFPMVRVDLYDIEGEIVFSEMTFTPGGALIPFEPRETDYKLGKKLNICELVADK